MQDTEKETENRQRGVIVYGWQGDPSYARGYYLVKGGWVIVDDEKLQREIRIPEREVRRIEGYRPLAPRGQRGRGQ